MPRLIRVFRSEAELVESRDTLGHSDSNKFFVLATATDGVSPLGVFHFAGDFTKEYQENFIQEHIINFGAKFWSFMWENQYDGADGTEYDKYEKMKVKIADVPEKGIIYEVTEELMLINRKIATAETLLEEENNKGSGKDMEEVNKLEGNIDSYKKEMITLLKSFIPENKPKEEKKKMEKEIEDMILRPQSVSSLSFPESAGGGARKIKRSKKKVSKRKKYSKKKRYSKKKKYSKRLKNKRR